MAKSFWLVKSEPDKYSFSQLVRDGSTNWNGVRNFQARNYLRVMKKGDLVLVYHSGEAREVVGVARVTKEAYPDLDPKKKGEWLQVDLEPIEALKTSVPLAVLKSKSKLASLPLIKQSRLSCMPITSEHFEQIIALGKNPS